MHYLVSTALLAASLFSTTSIADVVSVKNVPAGANDCSTQLYLVEEGYYTVTWYGTVRTTSTDIHAYKTVRAFLTPHSPHTKSATFTSTFPIWSTPMLHISSTERDRQERETSRLTMMAPLNFVSVTKPTVLSAWMSPLYVRFVPCH